jgi:hypothetical protein
MDWPVSKPINSASGRFECPTVQMTLVSIIALENWFFQARKRIIEEYRESTGHPLLRSILFVSLSLFGFSFFADALLGRDGENRVLT